MNHFVTSNFNLMHSNSNWLIKKKSQRVIVDQNFNYFFFSIKNNSSKFDCFHIFLYLDSTNINETTKKIISLKKEFKKNNEKYFFLYFIFNPSDRLDIQKVYLKTFSHLYLQLEKLNKDNVFTQFINNLNNSFYNARNKTFLGFPFDIKIISKFKSLISRNMDLINAKPYKLIILDCDNTLWGGVLDEVGLQGIEYDEDGLGKVFKDFQNELKKLKDKGFLLSISSKNTSEKVWEAMTKRNMILSKKDFIFPKINWNEKFLNIKEILNSLNLRAQDTIFIDDNIIEIQKVKKYINKINTLHIKEPYEYSKKINEDFRFQKIRTIKEDYKKLYQYKIKSKFESEKQKKGLSEVFYKSLKQKIRPILPCKSNFNRILQIFNKTNQFNFSHNRYTETKLKKILSDKDYEIVLFELNDKFGKHGIISGYIQKKINDQIIILDFAMSCRVISRLVEDYMIYHINKKNINCDKFINYKKNNLNKELIPKFLKKNFFLLIKKQKNNETYQIKKTKDLNEIKKFF